MKSRDRSQNIKFKFDIIDISGSDSDDNPITRPGTVLRHKRLEIHGPATITDKILANDKEHESEGLLNTSSIASAITVRPRNPPAYLTDAVECDHKPGPSSLNCKRKASTQSIAVDERRVRQRLSDVEARSGSPSGITTGHQEPSSSRKGKATDEYYSKLHNGGQTVREPVLAEHSPYMRLTWIQFDSRNVTPSRTMNDLPEKSNQCDGRPINYNIHPNAIIQHLSECESVMEDVQMHQTTLDAPVDMHSLQLVDMTGILNQNQQAITKLQSPSNWLASMRVVDQMLTSGQPDTQASIQILEGRIIEQSKTTTSLRDRLLIQCTKLEKLEKEHLDTTTKTNNSITEFGRTMQTCSTDIDSIRQMVLPAALKPIQSDIELLKSGVSARVTTAEFEKTAASLVDNIENLKDVTIQGALKPVQDDIKSLKTDISERGLLLDQLNTRFPVLEEKTMAVDGFGIKLACMKQELEGLKTGTHQRGFGKYQPKKPGQDSLSINSPQGNACVLTKILDLETRFKKFRNNFDGVVKQHEEEKEELKGQVERNAEKEAHWEKRLQALEQQKSPKAGQVTESQYEELLRYQDEDYSTLKRRIERNKDVLSTHTSTLNAYYDRLRKLEATSTTGTIQTVDKKIEDHIAAQVNSRLEHFATVDSLDGLRKDLGSTKDELASVKKMAEDLKTKYENLALEAAKESTPSEQSIEQGNGRNALCFVSQEEFEKFESEIRETAKVSIRKAIEACHSKLRFELGPMVETAVQAELSEQRDVNNEGYDDDMLHYHAPTGHEELRRFVGRIRYDVGKHCSCPNTQEDMSH